MSNIERKCRYRDCERPARKGWTHCAKHYTAGRAYTQADEIKDLRQQLQGAVDRAEAVELDASVLRSMLTERQRRAYASLSRDIPGGQ